MQKPNIKLKNLHRDKKKMRQIEFVERLEKRNNKNERLDKRNVMNEELREWPRKIKMIR